MATKKTLVSRRAWNVLRLALIWARKGGVLKELRLLPNYIKSLCHANHHRSIYYNEREFSFNETPLFDFKMHRRPSSMRIRMPSLSCLKPRVDFDFDYNEDGGDVKRISYGYEVCEDERLNEEMVEVEDDGIDIKAEEFIAKFYQQMKLQRQISYLQYNDMLNRGTS